jgi:hypothetical protein
VNWESLIKGLAVLAAAGLIAFLGFSVYKAYYDIPRDFSQIDYNAPVTLDSDNNLRATLDTLEIVWEDRQNFNFILRQDPLFLGRVITDFTYEAGESVESEEDNELRLSATVIDEKPKAIIKYLGKSYVVQAGDFVGKDLRVVKIEEKQVILDNKGKRLVLINKPVSGFNESDLSSEYSNNTNFGRYNY